MITDYDELYAADRELEKVEADLLCDSWRCECYR